LRKINARADGQELRLAALSGDQQGLLPPRPEAPQLPAAAFDGDEMPSLACDDDFEATAEGLADKLENAREAIADYGDAIAARETELAEAEDRAERGAAAAGADEAGQTEPDDGGAAGVGAGEAAEDEDAPGDDVAAAPGDGDPDALPEALPEDGTPAATPEGEAGDGEAYARRDPMPDPDNANLFRRAISMPGS
jgi:hypothetical protein